jgi:hypothetical protein
MSQPAPFVCATPRNSGFSPMRRRAVGDRQVADGFEYKESDVAQAKTLTSSGGIKYDWKDTHSLLAEVEHTDEALVA